MSPTTLATASARRGPQHATWLAKIASVGLLVACGEQRVALDGGVVDDAAHVDVRAPDGRPSCVAPGEPDPSFGVSGFAVVFGLTQGEAAVATGVAFDSASRVVIAGGFVTGPRSCVVARLLPDGSRDPTFGANGVVRSSVGDRVCWYNDVAVQADGKIVAFGEIDGHTSPRAMIGRYTIDGTPDMAFGEAGIVVFEPTPATAGLALAIDAQQRLLVAGEVDSRSYFLRRYTSDGALDASFGVDGTAQQAFAGATYGIAYDLVIQPDGKPIAIGALTPAPSLMSAAGLVRYQTDGTKDPTFGETGQMTIDVVPWGGVGGALDSAGRLVVVGRSDEGAVLSRVTPDGAVDPSFGLDGIVLEAEKPGLAFAKVAIADDALLAVGQSLSGMGAIEVARYAANGMRDPDFGADGFAHALPISNWRQRADNIAVQPDGRIVVVGAYGDVDRFDMLVARYCP